MHGHPVPLINLKKIIIIFFKYGLILFGGILVVGAISDVTLVLLLSDLKTGFLQLTTTNNTCGQPVIYENEPGNCSDSEMSKHSGNE